MSPSTVSTIFRAVIDGQDASTTGPALREFSGALPWAASIVDDPVNTAVAGHLGRTEVSTIHTDVEAIVIQTAEAEEFDLNLIRDEDLRR
jgi:hypothetical protein